MGPEPCQNRPDASNISAIRVCFSQTTACCHLLTFEHHFYLFLKHNMALGVYDRKYISMA